MEIDIKQINYNYGKIRVPINKENTNIVTVDGDNVASLTCEPSKYYRIDSTNGIGTFAITLPAVAGSNEIQNIALFFTTGTNPNVSITSADNTTVSYFSGYSISASTTYELNCLYNGLQWIVAYGIVG